MIIGRPITTQATSTSSVMTNVSASTNTGGNQTNSSISIGPSSASVYVEQQVNGQTIPKIDISVNSPAEQTVIVNQTVTSTGGDSPQTITQMPVVPTNSSSPPSVTPASTPEETSTVAAPSTPEQINLWDKIMDGLQSFWDRLVKAIT